MFSIPVQTAIVNSIIGNALLAGIFFYLWRVDKRENALGYWAAAYATSACRAMFRQIGLMGYPSAIYGEALFGAAAVVLLWMGARVFAGKPFASPRKVGAAAMAGMGFVTGLAAVGVIPIIVPYMIAGGIFFMAGMVLLKRGQENPGIGYGLVGFLFALYGGYVFAFAHLVSVPGEPKSYIFGPIINLAIGLVLLVVTQRKQHFEAGKLYAALLREADGRRAAEDMGLQSEQRYRAIVDTTRSLIGLLTPDGILIDVNRTALERAGIQRQDVIGKPFWETPWWTHDAEQQQRLRQAIRRVAAGGHDRFESTHPVPGADVGYFNFFLAPIRDAAGQVVYLVSEAHDITARRQVEQTLHAAEQRFRAISEGSMLGVFATDPDGKATYFSKRATEITGIKEVEAVGSDIAWLMYPNDQGQYKAQWRIAIVERKPFVGERRHMRRDGGVSWVRIHVAPIVEGESLIGFVGTIEDINARKMTEQALRDSEERFSKFFALGPEPMAVVRYKDAVYIDVNEAWLRKFGYLREEVIGKTPQQLGLWVDYKERQKVIEALGKQGEVDGLEVWYKAKGGTRILADISAKFFELAGTAYVLWDVHDITEKRNAEIQLRVSEAKFSKAFHSSPDYMTISRLSDGIILDCNEAFEQFTGYGRDEAINRSALDLGLWRFPEQRDTFAAVLGKQGWLRDFQCTLCGRDGREMASLVTASTIDMNGEQCVIAVARDVSAQRRMEQELHASEEMFSTIFHQLPVAIAVTTREEGRYVDVNQAWSDQFGYARGEAVGLTWRDLDLWIDPEDRARLAEHLEQRPDFLRREIAFRAKDGRSVLTECSGRLFTIGGEEVIIWSAPDITERKRIEQALREGEEKFSAIFHRSPVALGVTSIPEGQYLDVNETWERQFRYTREQMLGKTSLEIGLWIDPQERQRLFSDLDAYPQVQNREVHFRRGDGKEILCELSGQVFELNGRKVLLWGAHDVTEHRRAQREIEELNLRLEARVKERTAKLEKANAEIEEAMKSLKLAQHELVRAEKLAALGSLVAGVAHELNTPIGNSVTVASTLHDKTQDFGLAAASGKLRRSTLDQYLEDTRTASELLLRSLTQASNLISSFKQVAVDQASAQRRRFDLKLVVEEVTATLAPMLKKTPFELELELADNVIMDSYPGSIGQVITNLVTNSLAHAFENRECGVMHLRTWQRGLHLVEMVFTDDGVGIPESDMKRVFDPFFTTKLGRGGSGLGLHIVYNLVTRVLGGRIQATSQPGVGTRFQISLPMKAPDRAEREV